MVVIHLKGDSESLYKEQCLYDVPGATKCGEVALELTKMQNMRVKLRFMIAAAKSMQSTLKDENTKGTFEGPIQEAIQILDLAMIDRERRKITLAEYQEVGNSLKGCAIIAFPQECTQGTNGLSPIETLCKAMDDDNTEDVEHVRCLLALLDDGARTEDMLPEGATQVWWASKHLHHDDLLSKYTGKNEKTKLVCKLTKLGGSVPTKEPGLAPQVQQDMMQYWHKKQEEQKKLVTDEDVTYGNSEWANPKGLKNHFQGTGNINWRPGKPLG